MLTWAQFQRIVERQEKVEVKNMDCKTKSPGCEASHFTLGNLIPSGAWVAQPVR